MRCSDSRTLFPLRFGRPSSPWYRHRRWWKRSGLPGSWGTLVFMPCSQTPVDPLRLTTRMTVAAGSSCSRRLSPDAASAGASVRTLVNDSPPRGARLLPSANSTASASTTNIDFGAPSHGLSTRCLRLAAFLPAAAVVRPPKTRFRMVVSLVRVGLVTHEVPRKVSACLHSLPPHPGFAWRTVLPTRSASSRCTFGRGVSVSPSNLDAANRRRHLPTVCSVTPTFAATS